MINNNNNNNLLTVPLGDSCPLNYINYNYKINQIKLFTIYTVDAGLTESNCIQLTDRFVLFLKKLSESLKKVL